MRVDDDMYLTRLQERGIATFDRGGRTTGQLLTDLSKALGVPVEKLDVTSMREWSVTVAVSEEG
jgi:hypothetical protein